MEDAKRYYKGHGPMTTPGPDRSQLNALPKGLAELCRITQGNLIHRELAAWLYDLKLSPEQMEAAHTRPLTEMLAKIRALDEKPLTVTRDPSHRMPCVCRHFSTMLCAMLREHQVPARARCGFGAYFNPGKFEDHWVCEYWHPSESRWILVDAQLDEPQCKVFKPDFDPLDVPRNRFILAGDAWQMCRSGSADPDQFGLSLVPHLHGLWFVAGNVLRDLASLNRMEMLPWDVWGMMSMEDAGLSNEKRALLDRVAALTLADDRKSFAQLHQLYESDDRLHVPKSVFNAMHQRQESVIS
ncbi:MAG: transglutaminase domain-containing protein [Deltaproteobacteria bacterium]|nr:transglutaminase domain-containing protein [Deltaproteobacteria bacterium]